MVYDIEDVKKPTKINKKIQPLHHISVISWWFWQK